MSENYEDRPAENKVGICRVTAQPFSTNGETVSPQERTLLQRIFSALLPRFWAGEGLGWAYTQARVAQEQAVAYKTFQEAANISAEREVRLADAECKRTDAMLKKKEVEKKKIENTIQYFDLLRQLSDLDGPQKKAAEQMLQERFPEYTRPVSEFKYLAERLRLEHGTSIAEVPTQENAGEVLRTPQHWNSDSEDAP